ncbi:hypothetical protein [Inediibacterium massiliense]|uniref:hypothetical protein n=1 Tax=Inediibacterium massiliense TaxID=1658111 RepID=UPI0006B4FD17|nr:hypothetical protein [Inediibacterium massiliense]
MKGLFKRSFIIFILFIFTTSIGLAKENIQIIKAHLKNTNIIINHENQSLNTIYYKDHLYIPITLLSEKLNCTSTYNNHTLTLKNNFVFEDFPDCNPYKGENFIYGEILKIDQKNKTFTIEQHFDDNSILIEPNITISENVIIILQRNDKKMNLDFDDLKIGDLVGVVLNQQNIARGIILTN